MKNRPRIETLQGLRGIAFLSVLVSHIGVPWLESLGQWAVSVFLMLYNYYGGISNSSKPINRIRFAIKKLIYIYPLYIICIVAMLIMRQIFNPFAQSEYPFVILKIIINSTMIQEWFFFDKVLSLNPVSWYMCSVLLSYVCFPSVINFFEKCNNRKALIAIIMAIVIQLVVGGIAIGLQTFDVRYELGIRRNILWWIVYYFPPTRLIDFFIGCNLGYIYLSSSRELSVSKHTLLEMISICFVIVSIVCGQRLYLVNFERWYTYVFLYTIPSVFVLRHWCLSQ